MIDSITYYKIEVEYFTFQFKTWIPYSGELTGINDWWTSSPIRFSSYEDALKTINASESFRDCKWRISKFTILHEVVKENI